MLDTASCRLISECICITFIFHIGRSLGILIFKRQFFLIIFMSVIHTLRMYKCVGILSADYYGSIWSTDFCRRTKRQRWDILLLDTGFFYITNRTVLWICRIHVSVIMISVTHFLILIFDPSQWQHTNDWFLHLLVVIRSGAISFINAAITENYRKYTGFDYLRYQL